MQSFEVRKLTPHIGAEIVGLDISRPLDAETVKAVRKAWLDNLMLVFRGQTLDTDQQRRFVGYFGEMGKRGAQLPSNRPRPQGPDYNSDAMLVSNIRKDGMPIGVLPDGEMWFHHDTSYYPEPHRATLLYAMKLTSWGGETCFSNMYKAYEMIPRSLRDRLEAELEFCRLSPICLFELEYGAAKRPDLPVLRQRVEREVRRDVGDVVEERLVLVVDRMVLEAVQRVVGRRRRRVRARVRHVAAPPPRADRWASEIRSALHSTEHL